MPYVRAFYHWGGYTSGIRRKNIRIYYKVSFDDEVHLLLCANQNIRNLVISHKKYKHRSYGKFHHGFRNTKHQNCKSEANINFANPNYEP